MIASFEENLVTFDEQWSEALSKGEKVNIIICRLSYSLFEEMWWKGSLAIAFLVVCLLTVIGIWTWTVKSCLSYRFAFIPLCLSIHFR